MILMSFGIIGAVVGLLRWVLPHIEPDSPITLGHRRVVA